MVEFNFHANVYFIAGKLFNSWLKAGATAKSQLLCCELFPVLKERLIRFWIYNKKDCNNKPAITEAVVVTIPGNIKL